MSEFNLSDNAVKQFNDLYSFKNESIFDTFKRVSKEFATNEEEEKEAFDLLSNNIWRPNTPVFLNAGKETKVYSACFVVGLDDSMNSIYDIANVARRIFQFGSGIGIPIGNLREANAYIYEGKPENIPEGKSCLTGDTILLNDKNSLSIKNQQITIEWLYDYYQNVKKPKYKVRSMLDDFGIGMNIITDVIYNGKRPIYEIETKDGYKIKATSNHRFLSENGEWKKVEDFSIKDKIGVNGKTRTTAECKRCGKVRLLRGSRSKYEGLCENCVVSVFHECSLKGSDEEFEKRSNAKKEYRNKKEVKKYYSEINSGENNPMWRGDYANETTARGRNKNIYLWYRENHTCERCGDTKKRIEVHHKDGNPYNNEISNLEVLCIQCHNDEHKKRRALGNYRLTTEVYFDEIINIEYKGIEKTYDIKMKEPYHNFIANGFVSHNSGPITFMKLFDAVGGTTKSGGRVRRAAIMCSMPVWHPDIMDFIKCKEIDGNLANMNISVNITNKFMQSLKDKVHFNLYSPHDGEFVKKIDPQELWDNLVEMAYKSADPGVLFDDTINEYNPLVNDILIQSVNPCVVGSTLIHTNKGEKSIYEIYNDWNENNIDYKILTYNLENDKTELDIIDNVLLTKKDAEIYEIELENGETLQATPDHKVYIENKGWIEIKNIEINDIIKYINYK